ncbi:hypothetical protein F5148DRAFT_1289967, partial [Russula earlei]
MLRMIGVVAQIKQVTAKAIKELYQTELADNQVLVNATKPEFEGDYTVVLFAFVKQLKTSPDALGQALGSHLVAQHPQLFTSFNVIKGFLNLVVANEYWLQFIAREHNNAAFGKKEKTGQTVMVEYSSPNTNKPLHLGHLRNNFLGWSIAEILKASGNEVIKTCIVNDRGIHICKSMLAWQLSANGSTPESSGIKGDHFVGDYYVQFETISKKETKEALDKLLEDNDLSLFNYDSTAQQKA